VNFSLKKLEVRPRAYSIASSVGGEVSVEHRPEQALRLLTKQKTRN